MHGVLGRPKLFETVQCVKEFNIERWRLFDSDGEKVVLLPEIRHSCLKNSPKMLKENTTWLCKLRWRRRRTGGWRNKESESVRKLKVVALEKKQVQFLFKFLHRTRYVSGGGPLPGGCSFFASIPEACSPVLPIRAESCSDRIRSTGHPRKDTDTPRRRPPGHSSRNRRDRRIRLADEGLLLDHDGMRPLHSVADVPTNAKFTHQGRCLA